jgi:hypothetical protein
VSGGVERFEISIQYIRSKSKVLFSFVDLLLVCPQAVRKIVKRNVSVTASFVVICRVFKVAANASPSKNYVSNTNIAFYISFIGVFDKKDEGQAM